MIVEHIQEQIYFNFQKNLQKLILFFRKLNFIKILFLENWILLRLTLVNFRPKLKKQTIFRPNSLGNSYSALNFVSNGVQYAKINIFKKNLSNVVLCYKILKMYKC